MHGIAIIIDDISPTILSVKFPLVAKCILNRSTINKTINKIISPARTPLENGRVCPLNINTSASIKTQNKVYHLFKYNRICSGREERTARSAAILILISIDIKSDYFME